MEAVTMKKLLLCVVVVGVTSFSWAGTARQDAVNRMDNAAQVLHEILAAPDQGIPQEVLESAHCVAVVPHMLKGGFIVGAKQGKGVATCRTGHGRSAPALFTVGGGRFGAQIGVEAVDLVMIPNAKGMQRRIARTLEIGGDASAAG